MRYQGFTRILCLCYSNNITKISLSILSERMQFNGNLLCHNDTTRNIVIIFIRFTFISWRDYLKIVGSVSSLFLSTTSRDIIYCLFVFCVIFYYTVHIILYYNSWFLFCFVSLAKCMYLRLQLTDPAIRILPGIHVELRIFLYFMLGGRL